MRRLGRVLAGALLVCAMTVPTENGRGLGGELSIPINLEAEPSLMDFCHGDICDAAFKIERSIICLDPCGNILARHSRIKPHLYGGIWEYRHSIGVRVQSFTHMIDANFDWRIGILANNISRAAQKSLVDFEDRTFSDVSVVHRYWNTLVPIEVTRRIRSIDFYPAPIGFDSRFASIDDTHYEGEHTKQRNDSGCYCNPIEGRGGFQLQLGNRELLRPGEPLFVFMSFFVLPMFIGFAGLFFKNVEDRFSAFVFALMGLSGYAFFFFLAKSLGW